MKDCIAERNNGIQLVFISDSLREAKSKHKDTGGCWYKIGVSMNLYRT